MAVEGARRFPAGLKVVTGAGCLLGGLLTVLAFTSCDVTAPPPATGASDAAEPPAAPSYDSKSAGTISGVVRWTGDLPDVPPLAIHVLNLPEIPLRPPREQPNPNRPDIDPQSKVVRKAVVFLRGVDPAHARPRDHPAVRIEMRDWRFHVLQGSLDSNIGFVRRGDDVSMLSHDHVFHSLHADGASFFTTAFPDPEVAVKHRLNESGVIELTSAAGYYWMRAYLFVCDHPYFTRTDDHGRFTFDGVPPGSYSVVAWLPNWVPAAHARDPETGYIMRMSFARTIERSGAVEVATGASRPIELTLGAGLPKPDPVNQ